MGGSGGATAPSTGVHALAQQSIFVDHDFVTTAPVNTQSAGSSLVIAVGRGIGSLLVPSAISDNKGNTPFVQQAKLSYTDYPNSSAAFYTFLNASGGLGHTFSLGNQRLDEGTIAAVEVRNGLVLQDVHAAKMPAGNLVSPTVTTTGPATIVAFAWGGGGNGWSSVGVNNGFAVLDSWGASDGVSVQAASASRDVAAAGTYSVTWALNPPQEAILFIAAIQ
jgi:hypothetical protein